MEDSQLALLRMRRRSETSESGARIVFLDEVDVAGECQRVRSVSIRSVNFNSYQGAVRVTRGLALRPFNPAGLIPSLYFAIPGPPIGCYCPIVFR